MNMSVCLYRTRLMALFQLISWVGISRWVSVQWDSLSGRLTKNKTTNLLSEIIQYLANKCLNR